MIFTRKSESPARPADSAGEHDFTCNTISLEKEANLMPGFDRTGPQGWGAMSGGGRGACNPAALGSAGMYGNGRGGFGRRGFSQNGFGPGSFRGRGQGRGRGWFPPSYASDPPVSAAEELQLLKNESLAMKDALDAINRRIEELDKETSAS